MLAWHEHVERGHRLDCLRWLIGEARLSIRDGAERIAWWLEDR